MNSQAEAGPTAAERTKRIRWRGGCVLLALSVALACVLHLLIYAYGGTVNLSLDPDLVPTAQFLIDNPLPTPSYLVRVYAEPDTLFGTETRVCATVDLVTLFGPSAEEDSHYMIALYVEFRINQGRIPLRKIFDARGFLIEDNQFWACTHVDLQPGVHLAQVDVRTSPFAGLGIGRVRTYRWAFEVE